MLVTYIIYIYSILIDIIKFYSCMQISTNSAMHILFLEKNGKGKHFINFQ